MALGLFGTGSHWHWVALAMGCLGTGSSWHWVSLALGHLGTGAIFTGGVWALGRLGTEALGTESQHHLMKIKSPFHHVYLGLNITKQPIGASGNFVYSV
jgi:hypothetical protein